MALIKENTRQKIERSACALAQARRIEAYLPTLEERERHLQRELEELRALISDERAAFEDLLREAHHELRKGRSSTGSR
jgi:predicted RNase H-like nuclease (RuvC/YqgF family)